MGMKYTELEIAEGKHLGQPMRGSCPIEKWYPHARHSDVHINFDKITDFVWVGSVPITLADMDLIKKEGFQAILDLCGDQSQESQWASRRDIKFLHEFVHDGYSPTQAQFKRIVSWIAEQTRAAKMVYIHCHAGAGRAPTVAAAYLIAAHGETVENALAILRARRRCHIVSQRQILGLNTFHASKLTKCHT